jgi:hypothetical protein
MNLRQFKNLMQKLREHIASDQIDPRTKGLLGNILGELKEIETGTKVEAQTVKYEFAKIVELWNSDPVIQAYLQQKQELKEEISRLSAMVGDPWDD